jgi:hypothetical protein
MANPEKIILLEDFARYPERSIPTDWWVEGGERVWIDQGRLRVQADPKEPTAPGKGGVCTVWHKKPFRGDLRVEFDACVVGSTIDANNINFFLLYSDPTGNPLYDSRAQRADGNYGLYHDLSGYIFTFLNDTGREGPPSPDGAPAARLRMRRCPGFQLVSETFAYHCRRGIVYHVAITKEGGRLTYAVDGRTYLSWNDDHPHFEGLIGLRTYRTDLWWNNIKVVQL